MRLAIVAALLSLAASGPAYAQKATLPGIVGTDDRRVVEPGEYPWSAIGRLNTSIGQRCTGTMIAPRLVATAAHCLYNRRTGQPLRPEAVHFLAGYGRGEWAATAPAIAIRRGHDGPPGDPAGDWAIVTLAQPVGNQVGWIAPAFALPSADAAILRAGYGQDRAHLPMAVLGCNVRPAGGGRPLLAHDCDAVRGDSGSPILAIVDGRIHLLGVHSGHGQGPKGTIGVAVPATAFRDAAADWPESHPPPARAGLDPVPTATVRALALRLRQPVPVPSMAALGRLVEKPQ
ncbi:protease YdgD [Stella humosa]|uniref:Protease YdgD n=1 Tax=Stella humosa TaxID=94 RepID=A0A3N1KXC3_9PROT|nr:S1 family peptidase [Stella humosa]ROP83877.1 protease YdgD [Stella humosa]BBK32861.1 peptidase S1 [Stella humosa]